MDKQVLSFFDLNAWQEGRKLVKAVYEKTAGFPAEERFGLTSQMRRSSVSIIANIAEGFGRISIKEKMNFYNQAHGSLTELQSHIYVAADLRYLSEKDRDFLSTCLRDSEALLLGLLRSTKRRLP
ncbi:MAG: four helix bundle protein [Patescibacteria group bacterium]|nr:four helix bundle protein [Patescibacteria group bacterium]MDE1967013.1 four helix bundle protein [Patescibacteria group bacterium]